MVPKKCSVNISYYRYTVYYIAPDLRFLQGYLANCLPFIFLYFKRINIFMKKAWLKYSQRVTYRKHYLSRLKNLPTLLFANVLPEAIEY